MIGSLTAGPVFYILATILIVAALGVVLVRNMVHAALFLAAALLMAGGLYLNAGADMVAGFQVLIYVGAVVTLVLIAVMLVANIANAHVVQTNRNSLPAAVLAAATGALLCWIISSAQWPTANPELAKVSYSDSMRMLGYALLDKYLLPFEISSLLLLVALVGAIVIAQQTHLAEKLSRAAAREDGRSEA
jgi:NADH:ubiquinone oxidoreductase subunit 6 (subunit J)